MRERFKATLKADVEHIPATTLDITAFRTAAQEAFQGEGEAKFFQDTALTAELEVLLDRAKQEGLDLDDVTAVLKEVRRHVSVEAHFDATRAHENERTKTSRWNIFKHIALSVKDAATLIGGGVAKDVRTRQAAITGDTTQVKALFESALELGVMRRRMKRYLTLGGPDLVAAVDALKTGDAFAHTLLNPTTTLGGRYELGLNKIINELNIEVGAGKMFQVDGLAPIEVPDEPTKQAIQHHLKFVLRTEIIKLVEAEQLTVLSSEDYNIAHPKTTAQKAWQVGKGIVSSGTFWGITTRTGGRLLFGGALTAAGLTGGTAIIGGMVVGAAFGAAAAYVREKVDAEKRLTRRKLEAALGAVSDEMVKPASVLNAELTAGVKALQSSTDEAGKISGIKSTFKAASDAQQRLKQARIDKQDYISFGVTNRFQAQKELLNNIEKALAAVTKAIEELPVAKQGLLRADLVTINADNSTVLVAAKERFVGTVDADETRRQTRAALIGGVAGGFGSLVARYALDAWQGTGAVETATVHAPTTPTAEAAAIVAPDAASAAEHIAGSEPITATGKSLFFTKGADHYIVQLHDGKLDIHKILPDGSGTPGNDIQFSRTITLPDWQGDALQAVKTADGVQLFDSAGQPVGEMAFGADAVGSSGGDVTEQIFADPEASKLLDAMGLQKGELVYDSNTKLFHIPDSALHDAAGKVEYLGKTAGWRARRMEFILKALAEGKGTESPEMIVARAERATANLLLTKGGMHDNAQAAFDEAFGKDASFIQKNIMPWVTGDRSNISSRWMKVVAELKTQQLTAGHGGTGTAGEVSFRPFDINQVAGGVTTVPAPEGAVQSAAAVADTYQDFAINKRIQQAGMALLGVTAGGLWAYGTRDQVAHDPARSNQFSGDDDHTVPETQLKGIDDMVTDAAAAEAARVAAEAAEAARVAAAEATRLAGEKGPAVKAEIDAFIADTNTATKTTSDALLAVRTAIGTTFDGSHIDMLVANATGIDTLRTKVAEAEILLAKNEDGLQYQAIDAANGGRLAAWITSQKENFKTGDELKAKFEAIVAGVATKITETRKITDATGADKGVPAATRRSELATELAKLTLPSRVGELVPSVISDAGSLVADIAKAKQEAELAIVVIDLNDLIGKNGDLRKAVNERLTAEGCFNPSDLSLPVPAKASVVARLLEQMKVKSNGKTGAAALREMKLLNSSMDPFDTDEQTELKRVLDRLFSGESDIFSK